MLNELEFSFLCACQEAVLRQQELVPLLSDQLGVQPKEVFYRWVMPPRCKQSGELDGTGWHYLFHGMECDLKNMQDGRFLRVEFGPHGRLDTFSGFSVLQFVMTTTAPWRMFPALREFLTEVPPPYNELSGSHENMVALDKRIHELQLVEAADPELCAFVNAHTQIGSDGSKILQLPPGFNNQANPAFYDALVCGRRVLSAAGKRLLGGSI